MFTLYNYENIIMVFLNLTITKYVHVHNILFLSNI